MKGRVLVVDDDAALAEMLGIVLRGEGFEPTFVSDGDKAVEVFRESRPDLVLLDLMLPGSDGIDVCRQIRAESGVPIVMLTAKTDTVDVVLGLESGADDYIVKPFKSKELVARVRARLRRTDEPAPEMLQIGDIVIDVAGHSVKREGAALPPVADPQPALGAGWQPPDDGPAEVRPAEGGDPVPLPARACRRYLDQRRLSQGPPCSRHHGPSRRSRGARGPSRSSRAAAAHAR